ncbi:50S ribosomal protein L3 [Candidatus Peregrinibacteria bacterium]|nr:50S ribosomal protein L3 [Candidatus Peregrinibacteria bacterium]
MSGILGKKVGMTRLIQDDGMAVPVTVVLCEPNEITQVKNSEKDGYCAVVLGLKELKKQKKTQKFQYIKEFKVAEEELESYKKGEKVTLDALEENEKVKISATSKGKGFQGVIKKYNFSRGPESHGSHHHREPGAIGACTKPGRIHKGKKLPGRMGNATVTLNKQVILIDKKKNIICLKGPVPGPNGGLITIRKY